MTTEGVPDLSVFTDYRRSPGWNRRFVESLARDVPTVVPLDDMTNTAQVALRNAAARIGRKVVLRTYEGKVWACWIGDIP